MLSVSVLLSQPYFKELSAYIKIIKWVKPCFRPWEFNDKQDVVSASEEINPYKQTGIQEIQHTTLCIEVYSVPDIIHIPHLIFIPWKQSRFYYLNS